MHYRNLIVIGSSHVSRDSINLVKETIEKENPGIIAVELDIDRLHALFSKQKRGLFVRGVGFKGMIFAAVGAWIEKKIGKIVKVEPGSEMKTAIMLARKHNAKIALIDQNISITLRRFSQEITWKERWRFLYDFIIGIIMPKRKIKGLSLDEADVSKVPDQETIKKILRFVKKRYPNFYSVLVTERNHVMANNIAAIMKQNPHEKILAVVGAGHEEDIMKLVKINLNR